MTLITIMFFLIGIGSCIIKEYKAFWIKDDKKTNKKKNFKSSILKEQIERFFLSESFNDYVITVVATILGVTLAIVFTNYDTARIERNKTIDFLEVFDEELLSEEKVIAALIAYDLLINNGEGKAEYLKNVSFSPVLPLEVLLTSEPYVSTISSSTYQALLTKRRALGMAQNNLLDTYNIFDADGYLLEMMQSIEYIHMVIDIELAYQNKTIGEQEVERRIKELNDEEARETNEGLLKMLDGVEDSEWKSRLSEIVEEMEKILAP